MRIFLCFISFFAVCLHGAPVGNPAAPHLMGKGLFIPQKCWVNIRLGYEGDFVSDGEMKQTKMNSSELDKFTQITNAGSATLTLLERLDLYGVFGSSRMCAKWRFTSMADFVRNAEMETKHAFLWAVGGRAILYSWGKWDLGFGGRYSTLHNGLSWITIDGSHISTKGSRSRWRQFQVNSGLSYHIDLFTPYIGAYYLNVRHSLQNFSSPIANKEERNNLFKNSVPVGMYLGCSISSGSYFMLNIEGRVIAEEAFSVSGDFRF